VVKNREDRVAALNRITPSAIDDVKEIHPAFVFTYKGHAVTTINNSA
jgi:hypothetical protein